MTHILLNDWAMKNRSVETWGSFRLAALSNFVAWVRWVFDRLSSCLCRCFCILRCNTWEPFQLSFNACHFFFYVFFSCVTRQYFSEIIGKRTGPTILINKNRSKPPTVISTTRKLKGWMALTSWQETKKHKNYRLAFRQNCLRIRHAHSVEKKKTKKEKTIKSLTFFSTGCATFYCRL